MRNSRSVTTYKQDGSTLIVAVIVAAMLLTIGVGAANMLVKDVELSADLVLSEKAYFAAESGVEKALLNLKLQPVQHLVDGEIEVDPYTKIILNLENKVSEFGFELAPSTSQKFRLIQDSGDLFDYNEEVIDTFDLDVLPAGELFQWKILCNKLSNPQKTISLINQENSRNFIDFFSQQDVNNATFATWEDVDKTSCFFSVQNLSTETLDFQFTTTTTMTPHKVRVHAKGQAGDREKHIVFDYNQKNLGSLFDFVLFHTDEGLYSE